MAERLAYRGLFRDGEPVRAKDLRRAAAEGASEEQGRRPRAKTAEPALSVMQTLEHAAAGRWLWETSERIEAEIKAQEPRRRPGRRPGRRRAYPVMALLLVHVALMSACWSARAVLRELQDQGNARRLSRATRVAWPDHPNRRLPRKFISRGQHHRGRENILLPRLAQIQDATEAAAVAAAAAAGMLQGGSLTRPESSSAVCSDGTWIRARTNAAPGDVAADPATGEIRSRRFDPDAVAYNSPQGKGRGLMCVFGTVRNQHPGERIILFAEVTASRADANVFTDKLLRLRETHPQIARGATAVVYDRALQPPAIDRLQNAATIALSKPKRNPDAVPPSAPSTPKKPNSSTAPKPASTSSPSTAPPPSCAPTTKANSGTSR